MNDRVFSGRDLAEALTEASRALGIAPEALGHVVLEAGTPGRHGISGTPARIAVLSGGRLDAAAPAAATRTQAGPGGGPEELETELRGLVQGVARAADLELSVTVHREDGLRVRIQGSGSAPLLAEGGAALSALDHLLHCAAARRGFQGRLFLECEGFRARDAALRTQAQELAAAVRQDGVPRETQALNAYERRVIHLALAEALGVQTFSIGEGSDRRVSIASKGA